MLNVFRENLKSLKWVLWIVAIAMVAYLGSYFFLDNTSAQAQGWAARVDDTEISAQELFLTARGLDARYRQMFGQNYDQLRGSLQLGTQAVQALIERQIILDDARGLGLSVAPEDLARMIWEDPAFQDAGGNFDKAIYERAVQRIGGTGVFEASRAEDLLIRRWEELVGRSVAVREVELENQFREQTVRTEIDYVVVPATDQQVDEDPSPAELESWYEDHRDSYAMDDRRRIRVAVISREEQMELAQVGDDEVLAYYQSNESNYQVPEQRKARHILFRVAPDATDEQKQALRVEAEAMLERIRGGEDFAALAKERSDDSVSGSRGGDLGFFGRGQMVPPFDQAVFSTSAGELAPLVETQFGFHIVEVLEAREAGLRPLEEVADAIRTTLKSERAQDLVTAKAQQLATAATAADQLGAAAEAQGIELQELVVERGGSVQELGAGADFISSVFNVPLDGVSEPLPVLRGQAVVAVYEEIPAGVPPLAEVESEVREELLAERRQEAALAAAEDALADHDDLASAAETLGLEVASSGELSRQSSLPAAGGELPAEARAALFSDALLPGDRGVTRVPAGALLYMVTNFVPFDAAKFAEESPQLREQTLQRRRSELRRAIVQRLRDEREIQINQEQVSRYDG